MYLAKSWFWETGSQRCGADGKKRQTAAEALETEPSVNGFSEAEEAEEVVVDGEGAYAIPGLIDLHFHGCVGADVCDGTPEALKKIAQYEASVGVTAIAPATMTLPVEELEQILQNAAAYKRAQDEHRAAMQAQDKVCRRQNRKQTGCRKENWNFRRQILSA